MGEAYLFIKTLVYTTLPDIPADQSFIYTLLSDNPPACLRTCVPACLYNLMVYLCACV
jgi:hypothetical protein